MLILQSINMSALVPYFELYVGKTIVGRDPRCCQITLDNSFISRRHAEISVEEDGSAYVRDLGSSNGTYINSAALDPKDYFVLEDGDILSFGVDTFFDEVTGRLFKVIFVNGEETNEQTNSNQNRMNEDGSHMNGENEDTTVRQCYVVLQRLNLNTANDAADDDDNRMVESTIDDDNARCNGGNHCTSEEEEESRKRRRSQEDIDVTSSKKLRNDEEEKMDYTMDEVIFCNDDESDEFPCSQIFDHVQEECIHEDDNEKESDQEIIEIDDEDDEFDETERHWINRLSQTFDCPKQVEIPVFKENIVEEDIEIIEIEDEDEEFDYNERHLINICGEADSCNENVSKSITPTEEEEKVKIADPEENISEEVESIKPTKEKREENEENLDNSLKPKRHEATRRQIKLVEAEPLKTNRRTRSKESKTRSNLTKVNASPLKPKLSNSQKASKKKLKSIASLDKSDEATRTLVSEAPAKDPSPSKGKSRAKLTRKNRTDLLLDSLVGSKPCTSKTFKIPKLRKSRSNKNETPSNEQNVGDTCKQNVDKNCKENDEMPTSASITEIPLATPATANNSNSLPQCTVISKRKSVSFNEQIQIKEIESLPGTRKYEVSKLGHKAIRKVDQEFPIKITTTYKPQCKLDEIFSYILRWSVTWLEEEKRNGAAGNQRRPPPVGFEIPIRRLPHEFESFFEYYKCVLPLALLETWAKISNDYFNKSNQDYLVKVDSFRKDKLEISMLPNSTACRQQLVIDCHTYMHERDMREGLLRIGDLGIAELRFNVNGQIKHVFINVFCYVQNVSSSKVSDSPYIGDSDLLQKLGLEFNTNLHRVHVGLLVKCRSEEESLVTNAIVRLKIVSYIRPTLKHFVSLLNLETSPLMPAILKPSTFDFSVEEFKIHKFHGKLNSAQEQAVAHATKLCMGSKPNIGLIHGPPGTGKSHVIINLIQTLISESIHKFNKHPRILLCAPTNAAIDQLVLKLKDIRSKLPGKT
ncbi:helicase SEN1 isoform X2 [Nilaparvata lugens]|uniref:helicase SEN1 isoform X1 n=1 Tax=Nilaparvata lugens TaxID=108931 RepID=UPI00193E064D|nr:helicase SEN1 isoform X1 [Nilaparvata lugens]XP_039283996.1 helicase SEN1 isoform X2 [Nilaparvata lugens]